MLRNFLSVTLSLSVTPLEGRLLALPANIKRHSSTILLFISNKVDKCCNIDVKTFFLLILTLMHIKLDRLSTTSIYSLGPMLYTFHGCKLRA